MKVGKVRHNKHLLQKYQGMKDKFNKFDEALEKYAVDMDETADIMQETDQSLASKINGLT